MKPVLEQMAELRARTRRLVVEYHKDGLGKMAPEDVRLLLAEKQRHLAEVSDRCYRGEEVHVNSVLKRSLEAQVGEIGRRLPDAGLHPAQDRAREPAKEPDLDLDR